MRRLSSLSVFLSLTLAGCGTTPTATESTREIVLQYLGADAAVGTAGPFAKSAKREIGVLSPTDRAQAEALIDKGAVVFLVYAAQPASAATEAPSATSTVSRVVLVQRNQVVGDFRVAPGAAP